MNAASDEPASAKQRLREEAFGWTEHQARQALAAATGRIIDDWGNLGRLAGESVFEPEPFR